MNSKESTFEATFLHFLSIFSFFLQKTSFSLSVSDKMNTYALSDGCASLKRVRTGSIWDVLMCGCDTTTVHTSIWYRFRPTYIVRKVRLPVRQLSFLFKAFSAFSSKTSFSLNVSDTMNAHALSDNCVALEPVREGPCLDVVIRGCDATTWRLSI